MNRAQRLLIATMMAFVTSIGAPSVMSVMAGGITEVQVPAQTITKKFAPDFCGTYDKAGVKEMGCYTVLTVTVKAHKELVNAQPLVGLSAGACYGGWYYLWLNVSMQRYSPIGLHLWNQWTNAEWQYNGCEVNLVYPGQGYITYNGWTKNGESVNNWWDGGRGYRTLYYEAYPQFCFIPWFGGWICQGWTSWLKQNVTPAGHYTYSGNYYCASNC